jgi:hypothetical protein
MKSLKQILEEKAGAQKDNKRHVSREFQDYAYRLTMDLGDEKHKSLYMKLAKTVDRALLESARRYAVDSNSDKKGAVFMWKLTELRKNKK